MSKLSQSQLYHLEILSIQDGPTTLDKIINKYNGVRIQTLESLIARKLINVKVERNRKRSNRYSISHLGKVELKNENKSYKH